MQRQALAARTRNGRWLQQLPPCFVLQSWWGLGMVTTSAGYVPPLRIKHFLHGHEIMCVCLWHVPLLPVCVQMALASQTQRCWHATQLCMGHQWLRRISREIVQGTLVMSVPGYRQPLQPATQTLDCSAACLAGVISGCFQLMLDESHV
jgi:hypothetical protein